MDFLTDIGKSYVIHYHIRPDGDCVGSAYGLAKYFKALGNRVLVLGQDKVPEQFLYQLEGYSDDFTEEEIPRDVVRITVDASAPHRLGRFSGEKIDICIDHHIDNSISAPLKIVDEDAASCTEIIFGLLKEYLTDHPVKKEICDLLFMGIITDTNCFRNESVRPDTFRAAAELCDMGADHYTIAQKHALIKSKEQVELESRLINSYQKIEELGIVSGILTQKDAKEVGVGINKFESISSLPMVMEDTRISLIVRELEDGTSRVAVRTRGDISAEAMCKKYGGGGHKNASGCTMSVSPEELRDLFVKEAIMILSSENEG